MDEEMDRCEDRANGEAVDGASRGGRCMDHRRNVRLHRWNRMNTHDRWRGSHHSSDSVLFKLICNG